MNRNTSPTGTRLGVNTLANEKCSPDEMVLREAPTGPLNVRKRTPQQYYR